MSEGAGSTWVPVVSATKPQKHRGPGRPRLAIAGEIVRILGWSDRQFRVLRRDGDGTYSLEDTSGSTNAKRMLLHGIAAAKVRVRV